MSQQPTQEEIDFFESDRLAELQMNEQTGEEDVPESEAEGGESSDADDEGREEDDAETEGDDPDVEPEEEAKSKKYVPHAALHKERQKRKQIEAELAELRRGRKNDDAEREEMRAAVARMRALERRLEENQYQRQEPEQPKVQIPDYEADPIGHLKARLDQAERERDQARAQQPDPRVQRAMAEFKQDLEADEASARRAYSDYDDTVNSYVADLVRTQMELGYTQQQAVQIVQRDILSKAYDIRQSGRNPSVQFYKVAKSTRSGANPSRAAAPVAKKSTPAPPSAKVAAAAAAQRAVRTLNGVDGAKPRKEVLAEDLVKRGSKMSDKEFMKNFDKVFGR